MKHVANVQKNASLAAILFLYGYFMLCTKVAFQLLLVFGVIFVGFYSSMMFAVTCRSCANISVADISDHLPIFMFYSKEIKPKGARLTFKSRSLNASKMNIIANSLENIDWNNLYEMDVDSAYNHLIQIITNIIDQHAPFRQITINPKKSILTPWMTPAFLQSSKTFDKLYRKQLKHPRHHDSHLKYIKYRTLFNKLKRTSKELYYANLFEKYKGDIRKTWKTLNSITGHSKERYEHN